jgi:hypothetical protein
MTEEDDKTKRISFAPSIKDCLRALLGPDQPNEQGFYVYSVDVNENDKCLKDWNYLFTSDLVPDAKLTHEYWYLKPIRVKYECKIFVSEIKFEGYYFLYNGYENLLLDSIRSELNLEPPVGLKSYEILNEWLPAQSNDAVQEVLPLLKSEKEESIENRKDSGNFIKIFGYMPEPDMEDVYVKHKYMTTCRIEKAL